MTPIVPDQTLLDGLQAGQRDAFERLYAEYSAPIYNLCARVLCDREEAKDLTQDVFIAAFNQLRDPGAEPVRKLRPWLYRVAANACYNHLRARKRLGGGGEAQLENASCAVDEYERAETVALVEASLGQLNERYRTALVLRDLHGLPARGNRRGHGALAPGGGRARAPRSGVVQDGLPPSSAATLAPAPASLGLVLAPLARAGGPPRRRRRCPTAPCPHTRSRPHLAHLAQQPHTGGLLNKLADGRHCPKIVGTGAAAVAPWLVAGGGVIAVRDAERHPSNFRRRGPLSRGPRSTSTAVVAGLGHTRRRPIGRMPTGVTTARRTQPLA